LHVTVQSGGHIGRIDFSGIGNLCMKLYRRCDERFHSKI